MQVIETTKPINLTQLSREIQAAHGITPPLRHTAGQKVTLRNDSLTLAQFRSLVEVHVARPEPPAPKSRIEELEEKDVLTPTEMHEAVKLLLDRAVGR